LIALIAKARSFPRASPASFRPRVSSKKPPIGKSAANFRFGAKRPVLLQTHPGTLAVSQRIHDWLLEGSGDREGASSTKTLPSSLAERLPASGPRPNALPLHNVRYLKKTKRPTTADSSSSSVGRSGLSRSRRAHGAPKRN